MLTLGGQDRTGGVRSPGREPAPITFIAGALTLVLFLLLAILVFVAVWTARGAAKRATCTSQLRQLAQAFAMYRTEYGGYPPGYSEVHSQRTGRIEHVTWEQMLQPYAGREDVFRCPCDTHSRAERDSDASEERAEGLPCSYQYLRAENTPSPASGSASSDRTGGTRRPDFREAVQHRALLVCRHHGTGGAGSQRRVLIAYEDGAVKWQAIPDFLAPKKAPARVPQAGRNDW